MSTINLHLGDCLPLLRTLPDNSVDLFLQDPPYDVTENDWECQLDFSALWPEWLRVAKPNAAFVFTAQQPFATDLINSNRKLFRYDLIWYKALGTGFLNANRMPMRNHEHVLVFYRQLPTYNPQLTKGKMRQKGGKDRGSTNYGSFNDNHDVNDTYKPQSVIDITNGDRTKENEHPTQKPLALFRYFVRTYSNPGDVVFDGYGGSGTTAIACDIEGRSAIVCEKKPEYYDSMCRRYHEHSRQLQLFAP